MTVRTIVKDVGNIRQRILNVLVLLTEAGLEKDAMMTKWRWEIFQWLIHYWSDGENKA